MRVCLPAALLAGALSALTGCSTALAPSALTDTAARAMPPSVAVVSPESEALKAYYANVQRSLLAQDLLRTDGGGPDTPYTAEMLARNFKKIALYEEYANIGGSIVAKETPSKLHRWEEPVRMEIAFGAAVPQAQQIADRRTIEDFAARLDRLTRHPVSVVTKHANFHVFVVDESSRRALGPRLRQIIPEIDTAAVRTVTDMPRSSYCLVFAYDPEDDGTYAQAVAIIRAEHPDLLRLSCVHEELAQGMGLANDSPGARPSVFNDDEEFGLLTGQDEDMLRMLYDPRLHPGMSAAEAMPIVEELARERTGGTS